MAINQNMLPVRRAGELDVQPPEQAWLIESIWAASAVGIIGGAPKCYKSWFGIDIAVSVASGTSCLGRFTVKQPGPSLIFMAEDAEGAVRGRVQALCTQRNLNIDDLDLFAITASSLRLDLARDQERLNATLSALRPRLLLLDPLVRLHRLDENSAADISMLLGFIREMQRAHDTAIVLVHHASKKHRAQPGQALRGSSDLHAFGDSNAYLSRKKEQIVLTIEQRSAKSMTPLDMQLVSKPDGSATHLELSSPAQLVGVDKGQSLENRTLALLRHSTKPLTRTSIRSQLRVNNAKLGQTLTDLDKKKLILRTQKGWVCL